MAYLPSTDEAARLREAGALTPETEARLKARQMGQNVAAGADIALGPQTAGDAWYNQPIVGDYTPKDAAIGAAVMTYPPLAAGIGLPMNARMIGKAAGMGDLEFGSVVPEQQAPTPAGAGTAMYNQPTQQQPGQPGQPAAPGTPQTAAAPIPMRGYGAQRRGIKESADDYRQAMGEVGEARQTAAEAQKKAVWAEAEVAQETNRAKAQVYADEEAIRTEFAGQQAAKNEAHSRASEKMTANIDRANKEAQYFNMSGVDMDRHEAVLADTNATPLAKANAQTALNKGQEIDPDRKLGGAAGKIGAAIAMALGAYGSAITGAPNTAMDIINANIERDIEAQKAKRTAKRGAVVAAQSQYDRNRQIFGDDRMAELALFNQQLDATKTKILRTTAEGGSDAAMATAQGLIGQIDVKMADNNALMASEIKDTTDQELMQSAQLTGMGNRDAAAQAKAQVAAQKAAMKSTGAADRMPGMVATGEKEITKDDKKKVTEGRVAVSQLLGKTRALREHVKKHGWEPGALGIETDAQKTGNSLAQGLRFGIKNTEKLGAISGPDIEMMNAQVPEDPHSMNQGGVMAMIDALENSAIEGWGRQSRQYGYAEQEFKPRDQKTESFQAN